MAERPKEDVQAVPKDYAPDSSSEIYEINDARKRAFALELIYFRFFVSGAMWQEENQKLMRFKEFGPSTNYSDFPAQDIPIFLDREILEIFQESSAGK